MDEYTLTHPTPCVDDAPAYPLKDGDRWFVVNLDGSRAYFTDYAPALAYAREVFQSYVAAQPIPVDRRILRSIADELSRAQQRFPMRELRRALVLLGALLNGLKGAKDNISAK